ncbi:aspartyl protease family protein [Cecembia calidifontis]|jgi:predicted aspartyl protease|uniref:Aspartyl protease n=1 Tax=Cecembia calidifontis TaxID=1187080 RepID=A0A4Q7P5K9_9BACT|nr:aspartyl protease family protein [Cecembia calidifontis]RZS95326.1 aspartyl protease [Cecembia calidifontis]
MVLKSLTAGFIFSLCIFLTAEGQVPGFYMKEPKKKTEVPFYASNNLIILPVSINNGPAVNFLIDTGVKTNILFSKTIGDQLNMTYTRKLDLVGADGSTVLTANVSPNNHLDLGVLEGVMQTVLVLDDDFFELEMVIGVPVFGVIGFEFFKYNPVKVDYDKSVITFYETDGLRWRPLGFRKTNMKIENSKPYITGKVRQLVGEDLDAKLLIDLGANHGLLLNMETSEKIKLPPKYIESDLGRSLGGELFGYVGRVRSLKFGGLKFNDIITSFPEETEFSYVIKESGRQGSIGSELLSRTKLILDYRKNRFYFKKGSTFSNPFEFDMSGITPKMLPTDDKVFIVGNLRKNSPAEEAGIQQNDVFLEINKIPSDFWELSDLIKLFRSEEDRSINLKMKRYRSNQLDDYEVIETSFLLKRQI